MIFCSTIIPTIGRSTLARAVNSVLEQKLQAGDFEVIVVNDSGKPLPPAEWQTSPRVQIIHTWRRERSIARNTGAAVSRGRYLHFLDDDDWLVPGALEALRQLSESSNAGWLYGASQLVDREGKALIKLEHEMQGNIFIQAMSGEWVPLQSSVIEAKTFFKVGGFQYFINAGEDVDLSRRIALKSDFAGTSAIIACIGMGEENSSTDYQSLSGYTRKARELILNSSSAFQRLAQSARSASWKGRLTRVYLTSMLWNAHHRRLFTAFSRAFYGLASIGTAGTDLFSPGFWKALFTTYHSNTFERGFMESGKIVPASLSNEQYEPME